MPFQLTMEFGGRDFPFFFVKSSCGSICVEALAPAFAATPQPFNAEAFAQAQQSGKPILLAIHASWCPTCKAQKPILSELMAEPKFKNLVCCRFR